MSDPKFYGVDSTPEYETLAEATVQNDGTVHLDVVQVHYEPCPDCEGRGGEPWPGLDCGTCNGTGRLP